MVGVAAPAGMPRREFSLAILGASWPTTDPHSWQQASEAQHDKGSQLVYHAESLVDIAKQAMQGQSGQFVEQFSAALERQAVELKSQADSYFAMSRGCAEVSRLIYGQREDLDKIDCDAHNRIQEIRAAAHNAINQAGATAAIMKEISTAIGKAKAADAASAAHVGQQAVNMGLAPPEASPAGAPNQDGDGPGLDIDTSGVGTFGGGGRPGDKGMPQGGGNLGNNPDSPGDLGDKRGGDASDGTTTPGDGKPSTGTTPQGDPTNQGPGFDPTKHPSRNGDHRGLDSSGLPPMTMPFGGGGGSSGGGGASPLGSAGGLSNLKPPDMSSLPGMGGMGGVPQGLSPASGMGPPPSIAPPASPSSFSQGFNAGLGGASATPLAPPVASAPPAASAAPAGAAPAGPASVAAAAGPPVASPAASPMSAPLAGGPVSGGAGSMGSLPPFGSDVRSAAAASGGGAVTPASGATPPAMSGDRGGSAGGGGMAVPPGVVSSTTGAGAGATTEAVRSSQPDPLLEAATQLVMRLLDDSRLAPLADWCVGVFRTANGLQTFIVNSDGAGFIPKGVLIPRSSRLVFADPGLPLEFRTRWFSWVNPAETMLAFAKWAGEHVELYALVVSTDLGGSAIPARNAGVPHVGECCRAMLDAKYDKVVRPLDGDEMHRLEAVDRALYARLTGVGEGRRPDQSEAWRTTTEAAQSALSRAGGLPDLAVPPAIREVLDRIKRGLKVSTELSQALDNAHSLAVTTSAGLRPGITGVEEVASPHVLAHHDLARLMEILELWNSDSSDKRDFPYTDIAYLAKQINDTPRGVPV